MSENLEAKLKPTYVPFEFHDSPELEHYIEEAKEKYSVKLEKGKFYSRQHFEEFWKLMKGGNSRERFWIWGTYFVSWVGFVGLVVKLVPYFHDGFIGGLEVFAGSYGATIGAVAVADNLLPVYEKINSKMFNRDYKEYCEKNGIPRDS